MDATDITFTNDEELHKDDADLHVLDLQSDVGMEYSSDEEVFHDCQLPVSSTECNGLELADVQVCSTTFDVSAILLPRKVTLLLSLRHAEQLKRVQKNLYTFQFMCVEDTSWLWSTLVLHLVLSSLC